MTKAVVASDCWIAGQLAGIRMLEQELSDSLQKPGPKTGKDLERRLSELNSWVSMVDDVLSARARSRVSTQ